MLFFHLPDQDSLRATTPYHQIFALTLFWNVGLLGIIIVFFFIIFFVLKTYLLKNNNQQFTHQMRQSLLSEEARQESRRLSQKNAQNDDTQISIQDASLKKNPTTKRFKACNFLASFFFYLFWADISLVYLVFYVFGYMGRGLSHDILAVFIMIMIVVIPTLVWKNSTKVQKIRLVKKQIIFTVACLLFWLGATIFLVIALKGACLCYYNDKYGFSVGNNMGPFMSTEWTRTNSIQKICKDNQICNLYATVPQNTDSGVFINIHTGNGLQKLTVILQDDQKKQIIQNITQHYNLTNVQQIGKRLVHTSLFLNLTAQTRYKVKIYKTPQGSQGYGNSLRQANYRTTPSKNTSVLKLAVGGDVSMTVQGKQITEKLVSFDPDIIIIGGDNTYDDGMRTCYFSWDNYFDIFDDLNAKLDRLVPIITSVGNHDVGFDALATAQINRQLEQIPLYLLYNPQHLSKDNKNNIPNIQDRSTFHHHVIGPTVHLHLDSGYVVPFKDQVDYISTTSQNYKGYYLFANYHNPIYPSCTNLDQGSNDWYVIKNATAYWTPLFDSYNYIAGFQHHTHHKKFTKKIKNGSQSTTGTRYVGDGSWGVVEGSCPENKVNPSSIFQYRDTKQNPNHIWLVTLTKIENQTKYNINYTAIDSAGTNKFSRIDDDLPLLQFESEI